MFLLHSKQRRVNDLPLQPWMWGQSTWLDSGLTKLGHTLSFTGAFWRSWCRQNLMRFGGEKWQSRRPENTSNGWLHLPSPLVLSSQVVLWFTEPVVSIQSSFPSAFRLLIFAYHKSSNCFSFLSDIPMKDRDRNRCIWRSHCLGGVTRPFWRKLLRHLWIRLEKAVSTFFDQSMVSWSLKWFTHRYSDTLIRGAALESTSSRPDHRRRSWWIWISRAP